MEPSETTPYDQTRLNRVLGQFRAAGDMEVAFGGRVLPKASAVEITGLCGTQTRALAGLRVRSGAGLGGKALIMHRPVSVAHYYSAQGITHVYDVPVRAENLETVTALPVLVGRTPKMIVYVASRAHLDLGDRWYDRFVPLVRRLEREIALEEEVQRRVALLTEQTPREPPRLSQADVRDITHELTILAKVIGDSELRARVERVLDLVTGKPIERGHTPPTVTLAAREIDVLTQVALGRTNREVAAELSIEETTAKSYLRNAMRKLGAHNRVHAITLARNAGAID